MRITTVIDSLSGGGAERTLLTLAIAFQAAGHLVTMITFKGEQAHASILGGCSHISLEATSLSSNRILRAFHLATSLRKALLSSEPDLVISFMDQANILSLLTTFDKKIPVYVSERIYPAESSLMIISSNRTIKEFFRLLRNLVYRKATQIVLQSERMKDYFPSTLQPKMIVIPNPITAPASNGESPQITTDSVVSIGRLVEQKRFDLLIKAFAAIATEFPNWHLQIVGKGPLLEQLQNIASQTGFQNRIHFLGQQRNIAAILAQSKIFALCSDYEGFPVALGEAMYCGLPVIASDCLTGPRELLGLSEHGLLFSPGSQQELSEKLRQLIQNNQLRNALGTSAIQRSLQFSLKSITDLWLKSFEIINISK